MKKLALGIDTSNYKTSVAVTDPDGNVLFNHQKFLDVKRGERGLRQSEALFQHVQRLPDVIEEVLISCGLRSQIGVVAVSSRPRPVDGSYMPVFTAGTGYGKAAAAALGVPYYELSHQEGHVEAVKFYSQAKDIKRIICFHFSGGTTEALLVDENKNEFIITGGSRDLSYGQVLDRTGVAMGYAFPCGQILDEIICGQAASLKPDKSLLSKIKVSDCYVNLSGIETQANRLVGNTDNNMIISALFFRIAESIAEMVIQLSAKHNINDFIFAGGVSGSTFIRQYLQKELPANIRIYFGEPDLSSDNAVGISLLGGKKIWL